MSAIGDLLGHDVKYWLDLQRRFENGAGPDASRLLDEILDLRAKVSFYESRIKEMHGMIS